MTTIVNNVPIVNGKVLIFSDLHLGLKNASKSRIQICVNVIKNIIAYIKKNKIEDIIFLGDWNHVRSSTENSVLNVSYKLLKTLSEYATIYCILGNHDIYMKNTTEINSLVVFKNLKNVFIIDKTTPIYINGKQAALVPWLGKLDMFNKNELTYMLGHFDISQKYLINSYIEDNSKKQKAEIESVENIINNYAQNQSKIKNINDSIGNFVDYVKNDGIIFSGHIHKRKEFISKGRNFILVGSPYQQNLGEIDNKCGFYILDADDKNKPVYEFHEITNVPKHISLKMSNIVNNIDNFDFSCVKGNIIHKIYDIEVEKIIDAKISQKINDWQPYEELLPDYEVQLNSNINFETSIDQINITQKNKLDYVKQYINNIDKKALEEQKINSDKLYNLLQEYYNKIIDEIGKK